MRSLFLICAVFFSHALLAAGYVTGGMMYVRADDLSERNDTGIQSITEGSDGGALRLGAGYRWPAWRTEINLTAWRIRYGDISFGDAKLDARTEVEAYTATIDLLYDFPAFRNVRPFLGGGVGRAWSDITTVEIQGQPFDIGDTTATNYLYQTQLGVGIPLTPRLDLQVSYRYVWFHERETETNDTRVHGLDIGIRFGR